MFLNVCDDEELRHKYEEIVKVQVRTLEGMSDKQAMHQDIKNKWKI